MLPVQHRAEVLSLAQRGCENSWFTSCKILTDTSVQRNARCGSWSDILSAAEKTQEYARSRKSLHDAYFVHQKRKLKDENSDVKPMPESCIKYRLYPSMAQWQKIMEAFGVATWSYNRTLDLLREKNVSASPSQLRPHVLDNTSTLVKENAWAANVPTDIREGGVRDCIGAWKSVETEVRK